MRGGLVRDVPADTAVEIAREFDDPQLKAQVLDAAIRRCIDDGDPMLAAGYWKERWRLLQSQYATRTARLKRAVPLFFRYATGMLGNSFEIYMIWIGLGLVAAGLALGQLAAGQYGLFAAIAATSITTTVLFRYAIAPLLDAARSIGDNDRMQRFKLYNQAFVTVVFLPFALAAGAIMASFLKPGPKVGVLWTIVAAGGLCTGLIVLFRWARSERESPVTINEKSDDCVSGQVSA